MFYVIIEIFINKKINNATESFSRYVFSLSYRIFATIRIFFFVHFDVCII